MLAVGVPVVHRSLGRCINGSMPGEMGFGDGVGLLRTSGLVGVTKTPKFNPKRYFLDPICTTTSNVASSKMVRFIPVNGR